MDLFRKKQVDSDFSDNEFKRSLSSFQLILFGIGVVIGAEVYVLNRTDEKAKELAGSDGFGLNKMKDLRDKGYDLLIDCTSVAFPIEKELLHPDAWFMDIKSVPPAESLQKYAKKIIYGKELFIHQAVLQNEIWFKKKPLELIKNLVWKEPP